MMAKSKKNKVLAMALCASVMAGIYASPVMAASYISNANSSVGVTDEGDINFRVDKDLVGTIKKDPTYGFNRISFNNSALYVDSIALSNGVRAYKDGRLYAAQDKFVVNNDGSFKAANGAFDVDDEGNIIAANLTTAEYDLNTIGHNTQNINSEKTIAGKTYFDGKVIADKFGTSNDAFYVDVNGTIKGNSLIIGKNGDNAVFKVDRDGNVDVAGTLSTAGEKFTVDNAGRVTTSRLYLTDDQGRKVTIDANRDGNQLTVGDSTLSFDAANETIYNTQKISYDGTNTVVDGKLVADKFGTTNDSFWVTKDGAISAANDKFYVGTSGEVKAANNNFEIKNDGKVLTTNDVIASYGDKNYSLNDIGNKTQHITHDKNGTHIEGMTIQQGEFNGQAVANVSGIYTINGASFESTNQNGGIKISGVTLEQGSINAYAPSNVGGVSFDGYGNMDEVDSINGVNFDELTETVEGASTDVQHIKHYDDYAINGDVYDATVIEESVAITKDRGIDVISGNGTSVATITRQGNARFGAETGSNVRIQDGGVYVNSSYQNTAASLTEDGLTLGAASLDEAQLANINDVIGEGGVVTAADGSVIGGVGFTSGAMTGVVSINGASVEGTELGGLKISDVTLENGGIWAEKLNGREIAEYVTDDEMETSIYHASGIERTEGATEPGTGTTTIEGLLKVSGDSINATLGENSFTFNEFGTSFAGPVDLGDGSKVGFNYKDKPYTLGGLVDSISGLQTDLDTLEGTVSGIKDKTDHITIDEKGNVTITADDGSNFTVGNNGTATGGQGGQVTTGGNHNVTGDLDVDGNGNIDKDLTVGGKVTADEISANKGNIGNSYFDENGITVGVAGGQHTSITDTTVDATNGKFDNLEATEGNIGGVSIKDGNIVTGDTEISEDKVTVSGENGHVQMTGDDVAIVDKDGNTTTSLSGVTDRVDTLEQGLSDVNSRVDHLEDRIDKVGAMAAAIANLRTMGYDPAAPTEVAVGLGQYRDETGAALGLFHYPNRDFMLSLSVSTSGDEVMGGIGATWKFGRKSPEKVAEIKKAQAEADVRRAEEAKLAKAEEMKKAAKEAKIKAQQERHAKLAAERAAQAEAK